jgi:hypothetical protein
MARLPTILILCISAFLGLAVSSSAPSLLMHPSLTKKDNFNASEGNHTVALEIIRGFASGFLDTDIDDIGMCGIKGIELGHQVG